MKKWLICTDSFKDAATATEVCEAIAMGLQQTTPQSTIQKIPLSDGGDGFIALGKALGWGKTVTVPSVDALQRPIQADYLWEQDTRTAWIGIAEASGIQQLTSTERDGRLTSSLGTGILIADALQKGAERLFIGLGGSATNDGGCGMARALGYRFLDASGEEFLPTGETLSRIAKILVPETKLPADIRVVALSDVSNPLCGPLGATFVFGPQKGIPGDQLATIDAGMQHLSDCWRKNLGKDVGDIPGAGAAGGLGAACLAFLNGTLQSGTKNILELSGMEAAISEADAVITGEGRIDETSFQGKLISGILELCQKHHKDCYLVCGQSVLSGEWLRQKNVSGIYAVQDYHPNQAESIAKTGETLQKIGRLLGQNLKND